MSSHKYNQLMCTYLTLLEHKNSKIYQKNVHTSLLIFHCIKVKFRSSESETLFVFTVITRSQNIGRPLLKRFPSCAIVCSYIILLQHSPSQFAKHTGNIFFMSSQAFLCVRTNMCTHIQVYTYIHGIPSLPFLEWWLFQRAATRKTVLSILCTIERYNESVYPSDEDTTRGRYNYQKAMSFKCAYL